MTMRLNRREYLRDPNRAQHVTSEEAGVLDLIEGLDSYTSRCAGKYADACAATEMGIPQMFQTARAMLSYAPESLRREALDHELAEMMRAWHLNPDTGEWVGDDTAPARLEDATALDLIAAQLTGREWDSGDIDEVAALVGRTGREILSSDDPERDYCRRCEHVTHWTGERCDKCGGEWGYEVTA